ncbi:uncharacterized protein METZ01_LOCUS94220 [marine metagenome]|uniref:Uncharacterized protein n=1 Tax=marine metagenome TaxID=408172 RepID=A0A381VM17_9ZZZZ
MLTDINLPKKKKKPNTNCLLSVDDISVTNKCVQYIEFVEEIYI